MPRHNRRRKHLRVPVTELEGQRITGRAADSGLSIAAYLRQVGQGYEPRPIVDAEHAQELARHMGDLGRLGGLLKLWLTEDAKLGALGMPAYQVRRRILDALDQIRGCQTALLPVIDRLIAPATPRRIERQASSRG